MSDHRRSTLATAIVLCLIATLGAASPGAAKKNPAAPGFLDEGKLELAWFGAGVEFRRPDDIDYLWVKPGFTFDGQRLAFAAWPEPIYLGEAGGERDVKDKRLANQMNGAMPDTFAEAFRNAFGSRLQVVEKGGTVRVEGRIVDCSAGSAAAKFWVGMGAGAGNVTFDLKFVDARSGELLVAMHHRVVSGTNISTTDSKFVNWVDDRVEEFAKQGIEKLWKSGDRAKN